VTAARAGWRAPDLWTVVLLLGSAIIAALLVYPLSSVIRASFIDNDTGNWTIANYVTLLTRPVYRRALGNTFIGGIGGMLGSLVLGVTLAYCVTRLRIRGRAIVSTLAVIALVTPPFIGAYAWIVLFGANGVVRNGLADMGIDIPPIYGAAGVIIVFSLKFFPHVFLLTSAALGAINPSLEEAAEGLGLSPRRRFFQVTLRLILPSISAAALLTFVLSIADFGTPRIIGRGFQMLSTEAFILFASEMGGNPGLASSMSILLIGISLIFVLLQRYVARRDVAQGFRAGRPAPRPSTRGVLVIGHVVSYLIVLAGALPTFVVLLFSFRRTSGPVFQPGFGLQSYARVMATVPQAIGNSLLFAAAAVALIVVVGTATGYVIVRRPGFAASGFDAILMVPYIIPGVVMGIAFVETFNSGPVVMTGTGTIIVLAIFIRRLPYAMRAMIASMRQLSPNLEQAAVSLGVHPGMAFLKVTVPIVLPGIVAGATMSFVTAINELSSSLVLYVGRTVTMPVAIYLLVTDGEYGTASALSSILLGVTLILVYAAFRITGNERSLI
jgi:iron(III) transport system permease protein